MGEENIRSFIAIKIDESLKDKMTEVQSKLSKSCADVKWVERENLHITLKFLGDVSLKKLKEVKSCLNEILPNEKSFKISFSKVGYFPNINNPRVVWIGTENGGEKLISLSKKIEDNFCKIGFKKEDREFKPHLTIGRVKSGYNKDKLKNGINNFCNLEFGEMTVDKIYLMKSTLTPKGPIYEVLEEFILGY